MEIPVNPPTTFSMRYGDLFSWICLLATFAALGMATLRPRAGSGGTALPK